MNSNQYANKDNRVRFLIMLISVATVLLVVCLLILVSHNVSGSGTKSNGTDNQDGKNFKITFLDCSPFNRKECGDAYLKACQLGIPMVSYYCASQGLGQDEMDCMNFLEDDVLGIKGRFIPLQSSSTQSSSDNTNEPGRQEKAVDELSEAGEQTREEE